MAKQFAAGFYRSAAWRRCRDAYVADRVMTDGGMCEDCGELPGQELHHIRPLAPDNIGNADVTLGWDNLVWLCRGCHFKAHRELIARALAGNRRNRIVNEAGYYFDETGQPQKARTVIVYGSPCAGKSTYVRERLAEGDLVIDLDRIKEAVSMLERGRGADNLLPVALAMREAAYAMIAERRADCRTAWVIAGLPVREERVALAERLGAELVFVEADYGECVRRARGDVQRQLAVDGWWERFEA